MSDKNFLSSSLIDGDNLTWFFPFNLNWKYFSCASDHPCCDLSKHSMILQFNTQKINKITIIFISNSSLSAIFSKCLATVSANFCYQIDTRWEKIRDQVGGKKSVSSWWLKLKTVSWSKIFVFISSYFGRLWLKSCWYFQNIKFK